MATGLFVIAFNACNDNEKDTVKANVNDLSQYVDSVDNLQPVYTDGQWAMIDNGYQSRVIKVDPPTITLDEVEKATVQKSKEKYAAMKAKYETGIKEANAAKAAAQNPAQHLRDDLFGTGKLGADNQWNFVTAANVVSVYQDFVEKVRVKGDNYSDEEWSEVRSLWKSLNARKEEIENDIPGKDKVKIAGIKVAYAAIKSVNRPVSKINEEIKENK